VLEVSESYDLIFCAHSAAQLADVRQLSPTPAGVAIWSPIHVWSAGAIALSRRYKVTGACNSRATRQCGLCGVTVVLRVVVLRVTQDQLVALRLTLAVAATVRSEW
jgi:hypothetical protein